MQWRNTTEGYGWVAIGLHWLIAVGVLGLFGLGLWMVELTYYDDWYNRAPTLHKGFGILVLALTLARLLWRWANPAPLPEGRPVERRLGPIVHRAMLALLVAVLVAGYLISTAEGRPVDVFGWFQVPATLHGVEGQEDIAGWLHRWLSYALIGLVALHAAAALKHHFLDRDRTLLRMLRPGNPERPNR